MSVPGPTAGVVISVPIQGETFSPGANIPVRGIASAQGGADGPPVFEGATVQLDNGSAQPIPASGLTIQIQRDPPYWMSVQFSYQITPQPTGSHRVTVAATFSDGQIVTLRGTVSFSVGQGGSKPYTVLFDEFIDLTGGVNWSAVVGGIWVPPPSEGSNPGTPTFAGTVTTASGTPPTLTFPTLGGPPTTAAAMLVSQPTSGDLYRLAGTPPAANPAHLSGAVTAAPALDQNELNSMTATFGPQTTDLPGWLQAACAVLTAGLYIPNSIIVSAVALTLPTAPATGTLTVTLTGTVTISHWWSTSNNPFTFTETVALAPSGDPVDPGRILAATGSHANMNITGGALIAPLLAGNMAGQVTPDVENKFNQAIPPKVAQAVAGLTPPQQLAPQAVISASKVVITSSGLALSLSVADLFGPALIPVPPRMAVIVSLLEAAGTQRTIQVTVTDPVTNAPITSATVRVSDDFSRIKASGVTDGTGNAELTYTWCSEPGNGGKPRVEDSCQLKVSKPGYSDFDTLTPIAPRN